MVPGPLLPSVSRFLHTTQNMKCGHTYAVTSGGQRVYTHLGWYPHFLHISIPVNWLAGQNLLSERHHVRHSN